MEALRCSSINFKALTHAADEMKLIFYYAHIYTDSTFWVGLILSHWFDIYFFYAINGNNPHSVKG